jgi:ABC-type sugar transport system permease subunit
MTVRHRSIPRSFVIAVFAVFTLVAVLMLAQTLRGDTTLPLVLMIGWFVALVANAYLWLFRFAGELDIVGDVLMASGVVMKRQIPLERIVRIRPMRGATSIAVIEVDGQRPVITLDAFGFRRFVDEMRARRPDLDVTFRS